MARTERRAAQKDTHTNGVGPMVSNRGWQEITLDNGFKVRVRSVPPFLGEASMAHLPLPRPPLVTVKSEVPGGGETTREDLNNADYRQKLAEIETEREDALFNFNLAYGVDVTLPADDSWKIDIRQYLPNVKWTEGPYGDKVDYIKFVVLDNTQDAIRVRRILAGIGEVTQRDIETVEDSFRN